MINGFKGSVTRHINAYRDKHIRSGVQRICQQQIALQPAAGPGLDPDHADVHQQRKYQEAEGRSGDVQGRSTREQPRDSTAHQLEN